MLRKCMALIASTLLATGLTSCSRALYTFQDLPKNLPQGESNLLANSSFESAFFTICSSKCTVSSGWSIEFTSAGPPTYYRTKTGAVTGSYAQSLIYRGKLGDDGVRKDIELYQVAVGPKTTAGSRLTFTLWVSGACDKCAPFIGIEAFDVGHKYLGESDPYFSPPAKPRPVQVSYLLPAGTALVACYIQVPEIYSVLRVNLQVDNASLTVASGPIRASSSPSNRVSQ
jgi:hypothetical protein